MAGNLSSQGLHSLATIIKRLEAATSRLEDLTEVNASSSQLRQSTASVGETVGPHVAPPPAASAAPAIAAPVPTAEEPASVKAFDSWTNDHLKAYLDQSEVLGGPVKDQAKIVGELFAAQRAFVVLASQCVKPPADKLQPLLGPMVAHLTAIGDIKDANRRSPQFNHLSTVAEGIPAAGWVAVDAKPGPHVADMKDAANFYGNRVIKEFKESDKTQVEWVKSFVNALEELRKYIMQHHTNGLTWNAKGQDASTFAASSSSAPAPAPPSASSEKTVVASAAPPTGPPKGLFAELGGGENVTKGLKKVDKSEMTHKNPELRNSSVVPASSGLAAPKRPAKPTKPPSLLGKKPAKTELVGNKWEIEYHEGNSEIVIENVELNQVVNIYSCKNSVIQIKGKVNAVNLISCQKTSLLLESIVSSLAVTNSPSFTVQVLGKVPTITVDTTDSGQIYLSKDCLEGQTEIITAKSSAINVSLPDPETSEEGLFVERAVPEQLKSVVQGGKLVTTLVEHAG